MNIKKINNIHYEIEKNVSKINLNSISNENCKTVFDKEYVNYRRRECPDLYNEIFYYLTKEELPIRLISTFMTNACLKNCVYRKKSVHSCIHNFQYNLLLSYK